MSYIILAVYGVLFIVIGGLCLTDYILSSLGLMRLAKRRGISAPWLSWIPLGNTWITGSLVDEYDSRNGFSRGWKHWLLWSTTATVIAIIWYMVEIVNLTASTQNLYLDAELGVAFARVYLCFIVLAVAGTAINGLNFVCMFKIYESTVPEKALKYFLISLLVPLGQPICLYRCSNKGYDCTEEDNCEIEVELFEIPADDQPAEEILIED